MKIILNKLTLISLLFLVLSCKPLNSDPTRELKKGDKVKIKNLDISGTIYSVPLPGGYSILYKNEKGEVKSINVDKQLVELSK